MIRTIFFWLAFLGTIFSGLLAALSFSLFYKREEIIQRVAALGSRVMLWIGKVKVEISGLENIPRDENVIFLSNHQSGVDIFILRAFLPRYFRFVVMQQVFNIPIFKNFAVQGGQILVDLTNSKQAFMAMRKIISFIRQGENVMIFPEGTRSPDGRLQEFKEGAAMLVLEANISVVPIAISESYKIMQRDELYGLRIRPGRVKVTIGTPIRFAEFQDVNLENARKISARLRETVEGLMHKSL